MNLRQQITNKLLELLFDGRHEYISDCEDASLEIMKLIVPNRDAYELAHAMTGGIDKIVGIRLSTLCDLAEGVLTAEQKRDVIRSVVSNGNEPVESEVTLPGLKRLAVKYRELMDERRLRIDAGESVESLDDDIDELLNETMLLTQSLLTDAPADSVDERVRNIHVGVVCRNASGEPDVVFYHVNQTAEGIAEGEHYEIAIVHASNDGYETPMIPFDEDDAIYPRLVSKHVPSSDKE